MNPDGDGKHQRDEARADEARPPARKFRRKGERRRRHQRADRADGNLQARQHGEAGPPGNQRR